MPVPSNPGLLRGSLFVLLLLPTVAVSWLGYRRVQEGLMEATLERRDSLAAVAARVLGERFDRLRDVAISLAGRVQFRKLVAESRWEEAIEIMREIPSTLPLIHRIFLADVGGTLHADIPALPDVRGKNFRERDWFLGVTREKKPYLSEIYRRQAESALNVVAMAAPIPGPEAETIAGILVLQIRAEVLTGWIREIEGGDSDSAYIVDRKGKVMGHASYPAQGEVVDYSSLLAVQKALRGEHGVETSYNPIEGAEHLVAYAPVPGYGWGVVVRQPTEFAFAAQRRDLRTLLLTYGALFVLSALLAFFVVRTLRQKDLAEATARTSEERFRSVAESANDAIISADTSGRIVYFNSAAERTFGWSSEEIRGQELATLMPERFHEAHVEGFRRYIATREGRVIGKTVELVGRRKNGEEFPVELSLATWNYQDKPYFTGILRDITRRKQSEEALQTRTAQLEAANKELETFSYSVSHDLRAPLRAIEGFSGILIEDHGEKLDVEGKRILGVVQSSTLQMGQLIDDLLSFSRISRKEVEKTRVQMTELVRAAVETCRSAAPKCKIEVSVAPLGAVFGDPSLLRQVLINLISNAFKFTRPRENPKLEIGRRQNGHEAVFCFRDNGVGFDERYADKLFDVFQRLHTQDEFEGTGVGLAIVRRVIHRHGGRVWAEAKLGEGAAFYFSLPEEVLA